MKDSTPLRPIDKTQLLREVELVEKILTLSGSTSTLDAAADLSLELMKTQKTNTFSSIDVNEHVYYRFDLRRKLEASDEAGAKDSQINIDVSLEEIRQDLERAKAILKDGE